MSSIGIDIKGLNEIKRKLERLPDELSKKVEAMALRDAMKPTAKAAKQNAAAIKDTGLLSKSIGLNVRKMKKSGPGKGTYSARVGPRSGFKTTVKRKGSNKETVANPAKYAHLVELGTSHSPAQPFIRKAVESTEGQMLNALAAGYDRGLANAIRKIK